MCFVERSCTEILQNGPSETGTIARPLEECRQLPAYVLLGDPGAGKTTVFKHEAASQSGAYYVTARDLIAFDERPEWHDAVLFIDGLDEIRAGSIDARTPFDAIRNRLNQLGCPRFRLSCRTADWLGATDRNNLQTVSPDGALIVLHLDLLTNDRISKILSHNPDVPDADVFMGQAQQQELNYLLTNPQALNMLVKATADGNWPNSRKQTLQFACQNIVKEHNLEHQNATRSRPTVVELMNAAGFLCAVQLIAGNTGYALVTDLVTKDFPDLTHAKYENVDITSTGNNIIHDVVRTNLFKSPTEGKIEPVHRLLAEYLAACYLASRVKDGLPIGRILALITGEDGMVVTELRGLTAWLAALSIQQRSTLIDRDPLGIVLYGDVQDFSPQDKHQILDRLHREAERFPGFLYSDSVSRSENKAFSQLGALATPRMEQYFQPMLAATDRSDAHQAHVSLVLDAMAYGSRLYNSKLETLNGTLIEMTRDNSWMPFIRCDALEVFYQNIKHKNDENINDDIYILKSLVDDIHDRKVTDPDNDLTGSLLMILYPNKIDATEVLDYFQITREQEGIGLYRMFWSDILLKKSTDSDVSILLDKLSSQKHGPWSMLDNHSLRDASDSSLNCQFTDVMSKLLWRGLSAFGDSMDSERLYRWLGTALGAHGKLDTFDGEDSGNIRSWLESRPEKQKAVISIALERCPDDDYNKLLDCMLEAEKRLYLVKPPADLGLWHLKKLQATSNGQVHRYLLQEAVHALCNQRGHTGLTLEVIHKSVENNAELKAELSTMLSCDVGSRVLKRAEINQHDKKRKQEIKSGWRHAIKSNESKIREGLGQSRYLKTLADVYFGYTGFQRSTPEKLTPTERLENFLIDKRLVCSVLLGLRRSLDHKAVPSVKDIIKAYTQDETWELCLPILAGLEELTQESPNHIVQLNDEQIRLAIAVYLTSTIQEPGWYKVLLKKRPELVAEVMILYVNAVLRDSKQHFQPIGGLVSFGEQREVAELASLPMLTRFPVRCTNAQLRTLDELLWAALRHADKQQLLELIEKKRKKQSMNMAQQVRWLAAGLMLDSETYHEPLKAFTNNKEARVRHLVNFLDMPRRHALMIERLPLQTTQLLIQLTGKFYAPYTFLDGVVTDAMRAADFQKQLIGHLSLWTPVQATEVMDTLLSDPDLKRWYGVLKQARFEQLAIRREADFSHPNIDQVIKTLNNRAPANAGDLAALTMDILQQLANKIRYGNTNDYRQYWNEGRYRKLLSPKDENACRDALLSDMRQHLAPLNIDAQPEGIYADNKRADISVSVGGTAGLSVPIEVKRNKHRDLWTAIDRQLIPKYTLDPSVSGHGIYLVFWFGEKETQPPPKGQRPKTPAELKDRLEATLSPDKCRKISICVVDVAQPAKY